MRHVVTAFCRNAADVLLADHGDGAVAVVTLLVFTFVFGPGDSPV